jgi:UDP-glucose 4-epimerase
MGRSKRSFDRILRQYKHKDLAFKMTKVPVLNTLGKLVIKPSETSLSYIPIHENLELPAGAVAPISVIEHFINEASDHLILSRCPCRSGNDCEMVDPSFGCTFIGPAVREVNPEVGRLVTREEALEHLRQATEVGLVSCLGAFKGDAIMMGIRNHKHLMTICHCCPCCCWSTAMPLAHKDARDLVVRMEGVSIEITENCNGCGLCVDTCMFAQIRIEGKTAVIGDECKGCGRCAMVCKRDGVRIIIDDPGYIDRCIERISALVEVK